MSFSKRRSLGMTFTALVVVLVALTSSVLSPLMTARAASPQAPRSQGLVEYAIILANAELADSCTDIAGKDIRPCTVEAKITVYSDGSVRGGATLRNPDRSIVMSFQKAKLTSVYGAPVAELSGNATVTDERGRTRSYTVRATVTRVGTDKLSGSVAVDDFATLQRSAYYLTAEGTFK